MELNARSKRGAVSDYVLYQLSPAPLLCNTRWARCKKLIQCGYVWEEVFDLISDGDTFL